LSPDQLTVNWLREETESYRTSKLFRQSLQLFAMKTIQLNVPTAQGVAFAISVHRMVGMTKSEPLPMPVGQRDVIVFSFV
jgi:hypothetical protein